MNKCNYVDIPCTHCLYGKMHNQSFPKSLFTTSSPFELVHSDLWVRPLLVPLMVLGTMFFLLTIIPDLHGFICLSLSLRSLLNLLTSKL